MKHRPRPKRPLANNKYRKRETHGLGGEQIEGRQAVRELLLANRRQVTEILIANDMDSSPILEDIIDLAKDQRVKVTRVSIREIDKQARSESPQGVVARARPLPQADLNEVINAKGGKPALIVAIDGVTDPGNLGAILRSCDGSGVDAVVLPRHRAVHITPTVAKAAAGGIEYLNICIVPGLPTAISEMKQNEITVIGLDDRADRSIYELGNLTNGSCCVVLGAEGPGLSRLVRERCDVLANIPMRGSLSSLNVSVAAGLVTYEIVRSRLAVQ